MAKFIFPQEIDVWYVLPGIRREFVLALIDLKLAQKEIAKILGVTEAAISQYVHDKRASHDLFPKGIKNAVNEAAKRVKDRPEVMFQEIMMIDTLVKRSGAMCAIHKKYSPVFKGCENVCSQTYFVGE